MRSQVKWLSRGDWRTAGRIRPRSSKARERERARLLRRETDGAADDELADQRRQSVQPAVLTAHRDQPRQRRAAQGRVARASARFGHRAAVLGLRAAARVRRRRVREHGRERRVRAVDRDRRDPLAVRGESRSRTSPPSAAAGTTRASRSAKTRSSSGGSTASSWRSIARPARSRGRFRPSAGRTASRSRRRRCTSTAMVIVGFAGGDRGTRSRVKAYDAKDGRLIWTFYTIPGPGEPGHETWPKDNDAWKYGGAAIWQTPAIDPELGLLYFSTGNAAPDYNGAFRAGDNLYAASMLAIDARDGKVSLALSAGASRHLGLRRGQSRHPHGRERRRPHAQGDCRSREDRLGVHPRSADRQAAHRHRRAAGAAGAAAGDRGDAAVPARRCRRAAA